VEMFYHAVRYGRYTCFLSADTRLDMAYMPDAIAAMIGLMAADASRLRYRNAYNITAMSVTPEDIAGAIRKHIPAFTIDYDVDPVRQAIADSWPRSLDDSAAHADWDWQPRFDLDAMAKDMLVRVKEKLGAPRRKR
jgi:nucleoside-diphosphate-sugar epimerase